VWCTSTVVPSRSARRSDSRRMIVATSFVSSASGANDEKVSRMTSTALRSRACSVNFSQNAGSVRLAGLRTNDTRRCGTLAPVCRSHAPIRPARP